MTGDVTVALPDETATRQLGERLARTISRGDLILLSGDLGAGKTFLARSMIQSLADAAIDVPSPTFNLAIPYELPGLVLTHYDLYRLSGPDEIEELGLEDAMDQGVAIVEWPDRLHPDDQGHGVRIDITLTPRRQAVVSGPPGFMERFHDA